MNMHEVGISRVRLAFQRLQTQLRAGKQCDLQSVICSATAVDMSIRRGLENGDMQTMLQAMIDSRFPSTTSQAAVLNASFAQQWLCEQHSLV